MSHSTPRPLSRPGEAQLVAAGVALVGVCYGFARFAYGLLAPRMAADLGIPAGLQGVIAAGSYLGYCIAIAGAVLATARWGARRAGVVAGLCASIGTLTVALAPGPAVLALGVLLAGASTGLASPPLADAVARWVRAERRDRAQTLVNAGTGWGILVSGPVAMLVAGQWRLAWLVFAVAAAAVTLWLWRVVPGAPPRAPAPRPRLLPGPAPGGARLLVLALAAGAASVTVWTFGRDLVEREGGMGPQSSGVLWVVIGVAGLAGGAAGDLGRRLGVTALWRLLLLAVAASTATLASTPQGLLAYGAGALFGAGYIGLTGAVLVAATRVWPEAVEAGVGAGFFAIAAGQALAAPVAGLLVGHLGLRGAFAVFAGVGAVAVLLPSPVPADDGAG
ncbi:MFS transporter [Phycicoccus endophyticus]|uniref:MFS transporter n=1 Tax=Phycicoccus endophyticus TaxID=1690220 RepID=UPI0014078007|nr:MFS transporter [Phycicoccus endophyticus]NHI19069.1 YbfB/YjiJ family MFS transporter [Phycicoccus endophyticus]GGL32585.1 MFS transporter [Phycicoccus endophyticus]